MRDKLPDVGQVGVMEVFATFGRVIRIYLAAAFVYGAAAVLRAMSG